LDSPPVMSRTRQATVIANASRLPSGQEPFRDCVVARESGGNPRARNRTSTASGKYQYLDGQWRRGLSYQVRDRLVSYGMPKRQAQQLRLWLMERPIYRWPEKYQDVGFAATLNHSGPWSGWQHWSLPGNRCQGLVPR
jgi:hypothetical protein